MDRSARDNTALADRIEELVLDLVKAVRAHHLYDPSNPAYAGFITTLREDFAGLWDDLDPLELFVSPEHLTWRGATVYERADRAESLAFLLHKDGLRGLRFLRGFEESDLEAFLDALECARHQRSEGDDLVTLLWERDLACLQYSAAELVTRGVELPEPTDEMDFDLLAVRRLALEEDQEGGVVGGVVGGVGGEGEAGQADAHGPIEWAESARGDEGLHPTLHALAPEEVEALERELEIERARPVRAEVASALLDALEVAEPTEKGGLLGCIGLLVRDFVGAGDLQGAIGALEGATGSGFGEDVADDGDAGNGIPADLVGPVPWDEVVARLAMTVEDDAVTGAALVERFTPYFGDAALEHLHSHAVRLGESIGGPQLRAAAGAVTVRSPTAVRAALACDAPDVLVGVVGSLAELGIRGFATELAALLDHRDVRVRRVMARALSADEDGGATLTRALDDPDSTVRVRAANGLARLGHRPAAAALERTVLDRSFRERGLTETKALMDAYAALAGSAAVETLDELLNGRGLLGPTNPAELRACAARALGLVEAPEARAALKRAAGDKETLVRHAVEQALRSGGAA